jgi:hypothetical protein
MSSGKNADDARPEYDLAKLGKGTRGKYFNRYQERGKAVAIDADVVRSRREPKRQPRR